MRFLYDWYFKFDDNFFIIVLAYHQSLFAKGDILYGCLEPLENEAPISVKSFLNGLFTWSTTDYSLKYCLSCEMINIIIFLQFYDPSILLVNLLF